MNIINAIRSLTQAILECVEIRKQELQHSKSCCQLSTIIDLLHKIMSAISEFATKQQAFNDRQDTAIAGLQEDVQTLNDKISELQNTPGEITPEDQALLDAIQARGESISAKLEALDALTPPKPPAGPPVV